MSIIACPTTVVAASVERVWELVVSPGKLAEWTQTRLLTAPDRPLQAGDRAVYGGGPGLRVTFNRDFRFPPGWRALLFERILGRGFESGPAESLSQLKALAEKAAQPR